MQTERLNEVIIYNNVVFKNIYNKPLLVMEVEIFQT